MQLLTRAIWRIATAMWVLAIITAKGCDTNSPNARASEPAHVDAVATSNAPAP